MWVVKNDSNIYIDDCWAKESTIICVHVHFSIDSRLCLWVNLALDRQWTLNSVQYISPWGVCLVPMPNNHSNPRRSLKNYIFFLLGALSGLFIMRDIQVPWEIRGVFRYHPKCYSPSWNVFFVIFPPKVHTSQDLAGPNPNATQSLFKLLHVGSSGDHTAPWWLTSFIIVWLSCHSSG